MKYGKCKCSVNHKIINEYKLPEEGLFVIVLICMRILKTYGFYISYTFASHIIELKTFPNFNTNRSHELSQNQPFMNPSILYSNESLSNYTQCPLYDKYFKPLYSLS